MNPTTGLGRFWVCAQALGLASGLAHAEQHIVAQPTALAPVLDGQMDDLWRTAQPVVVEDVVAKIPITLRFLHDHENLYLLADYPDPAPDTEHRRMHWNPNGLSYKEGPEREDVLVLKWNLSPYSVDLTLKSELDYRADIWFWKACRTAPSGYADDKYQIYTSSPGFHNLTPLRSHSGKIHYLLRKGDAGNAAYKGIFYDRYIEDSMPRFESVQPSGSRADIRAEARWQDGRWMIEMQRRLQTGDPNDIQFAVGLTATFGVSRYEVAGRAPDPTLSQPLYGSGEVGELIKLSLGP